MKKNKLLNEVKFHLKSLLLNTLLKPFSKCFTPGMNKIDFGDFERIKPFSVQFGFDRGGPVDRYYIENFLRLNSGYIKGYVLEVKDNEYTLRFGGSSVRESAVLDINPENRNATVIGDLADLHEVAEDTFDCIILTQTLQYIYDYEKAVSTCYRILKQGGVLLLTVPGISSTDFGELRSIWHMSFTRNSISNMLLEFFQPEKIAIATFGNVMVAAGFLYGMGLPEFSRKQMDKNDPLYQLIITAKATK